jgi:hypothetical protein
MHCAGESQAKVSSPRRKTESRPRSISRENCCFHPLASPRLRHFPDAKARRAFGNRQADFRQPLPRRVSRKNLPYNCGPAAAVGARAGTAEALRSKSIGTAPPMLTANLAPNGALPLPLMNGVNGGQAAANLLCKLHPNLPRKTPKMSPQTPTPDLLRVTHPLPRITCQSRHHKKNKEKAVCL